MMKSSWDTVFVLLHDHENQVLKIQKNTFSSLEIERVWQLPQTSVVRLVRKSMWTILKKIQIGWKFRGSYFLETTGIRGMYNYSCNLKLNVSVNLFLSFSHHFFNLYILKDLYFVLIVFINRISCIWDKNSLFINIWL